MFCNYQIWNWNISACAKTKRVFGVRHGQACLLFLTIILLYTLRMNLSMAIVSMTDTSTPSNFQVFNWTSSQKGVLLSTFFYGFAASNPPLGIMANRLPARYLLTACSLMSGLVTVLFPVVAFETGFVGCCIFRAVLGVIQGFLVPCISTLLAKWAVPDERAPFLAFIYTGYPIGSAAVTFLAGNLADSSGGWPSIFYVSGSLVTLWSPICFWLIRDSPSEHAGISAEEKDFIESRLIATSDNSRVRPIPWVPILKSIPLWAVAFTGFCYCWAIWTLETELPSYMHATFNVNIKTNGIYSAIPSFGMLLGGTLGPTICKLTTERFKIPVNLNRQIWNSIGQYGCAVCLAIVGLTQPGTTVVILIFLCAEFFAALTHLGFTCSPVDMSPNFAALLMGIVNGLNQIAALLSPTFVGFMLHGDGTQLEWSVIFVLAAAIMALGGVVYNIFGTSEVQHWNASESD